MRLEPWRIATGQNEIKKQKPEKRQQRIQKTGVSWKQKKKIISRGYGFAGINTYGIYKKKSYKYLKRCLIPFINVEVQIKVIMRYYFLPLD